MASVRSVRSVRAVRAVRSVLALSVLTLEGCRRCIVPVTTVLVAVSHVWI